MFSAGRSLTKAFNCAATADDEMIFNKVLHHVAARYRRPRSPPTRTGFVTPPRLRCRSYDDEIQQIANEGDGGGSFGDQADLKNLHAQRCAQPHRRLRFMAVQRGQAAPPPRVLGARPPPRC